MRSIICRLPIVCALLAAAACGNAEPARDSAPNKSDSPESVKVGYVVSTIFAPLFIADAKGYFKDNGIDIQLEAVKSGQDAVPLTANGTLDVLVAGFSSGMFSAMEAGLEVKVVGSMGVSAGDDEKPVAALIGSKALHDAGEVTGIADLKGKRIAANGGEGGAGAYLVDVELQKEGLSITDVELINLPGPDMPAALKNGSIDAAYNNPPFTTMMVEDEIGVVLGTPLAGTSATGVLFGEQFVQKEELAQRFFDALAKGAQDLQNGAGLKDENAQILATATDQEVERVKSLPLYTWKPDLAPLVDQLTAMQETWINVGALEYDTPLAPEKYVISKFSENAQR